MLFPSNEELRRFLQDYPYDQSFDLVSSLPSDDVPRLRYADRAVAQLQARGLDTPALFEALRTKYPTQENLIAAAEADYFADGETRTPTRQREDADPLTDDARLRLVAQREKVLGDRPTFLDVWFLRVGLQRAKAVVKLETELREDEDGNAGKYAWFDGTGVLINPTTVLTARHNLWSEQGERARSVRVVLDYERAQKGATRQGRVLTGDVATCLGDEAHDWAVLRLAEAVEDREPVPVASRPPEVGDRVTIVQHPDGLPKQVALHNNFVTGASADRLQYLTDTLPDRRGLRCSTRGGSWWGCTRRAG